MTVSKIKNPIGESASKILRLVCIVKNDSSLAAIGISFSDVSTLDIIGVSDNVRIRNRDNNFDSYDGMQNNG